MERNICLVCFFFDRSDVYVDYYCHGHVVDLVLITHEQLDASKFYCNSSTCSSIILVLGSLFCIRCSNTLHTQLMKFHVRIILYSDSPTKYSQNNRPKRHTQSKGTCAIERHRATKLPHNTPLNIQALLNHIKHLLLRLQLSGPWQGSMCHCMDSCCTTICPIQQRRVFYKNRYTFYYSEVFYLIDQEMVRRSPIF